MVRNGNEIVLVVNHFSLFSWSGAAVTQPRRSGVSTPRWATPPRFVSFLFSGSTTSWSLSPFTSFVYRASAWWWWCSWPCGISSSTRVPQDSWRRAARHATSSSSSNPRRGGDASFEKSGEGGEDEEETVPVCSTSSSLRLGCLVPGVGDRDREPIRGGLRLLLGRLPGRGGGGGWVGGSPGGAQNDTSSFGAPSGSTACSVVLVVSSMASSME